MKGNTDSQPFEKTAANTIRGGHSYKLVVQNCVITQAAVSTGKTTISSVSVVVCMTTGDFSVAPH
jgi:hypothetical protein